MTPGKWATPEIQDEDYPQVDGLGVAVGVPGPDQGPGSKRQGPEESNHTP